MKEIEKDAKTETIFGITEEEYAEIKEIEKEEGEKNDKSNKSE